jgi:hypothetical protein
MLPASSCLLTNWHKGQRTFNFSTSVCWCCSFLQSTRWKSHTWCYKANRGGAWLVPRGIIQQQNLFCPKLYHCCSAWTILLWIHTGHVMFSWTHFLGQHPKQPGSGTVQHTENRKHGIFEPVFGLSHGCSRLCLLKLFSIILLWIHTGHVMCSWIYLGWPCLWACDGLMNYLSLSDFRSFHPQR